MKKITTITLLSFLTCVSIAQTASDYYLPLCVNNETVLYTPAGLPPAGWAERITRHTFIQTDSIGGELYYLEKGTEYSTGSSSFPPHTFKLVWLKQDVNERNSVWGLFGRISNFRFCNYTTYSNDLVLK
ncbi:MAG: hypothetical protein IPM91_18555 [Bacteroidetes bacterium]|nr:hypothetical protein [Bacteroidota bacterium]